MTRSSSGRHSSGADWPEARAGPSGARAQTATPSPTARSLATDGPEAAAALFAILAGHAARTETPTIDEFAHLPSGFAILAHGDFLRGGIAGQGRGGVGAGDLQSGQQGQGNRRAFAIGVRPFAPPRSTA